MCDNISTGLVITLRKVSHIISISFPFFTLGNFYRERGRGEGSNSNTEFNKRRREESEGPK